LNGNGGGMAEKKLTLAEKPEANLDYMMDREKVANSGSLGAVLSVWWSRTCFNPQV
jgi:hypothetical protein